MDFLVAAWSIPNGRIRKFLLLLAIPVALLAYFLGVDPFWCAALAVVILWMLPYLFKGCVKNCLVPTATKNSSAASPHMTRALDFHRKEDYDRAIVEYGMAISIDRYDVSAYNLRGVLFSLQRQYDYAIVDYTSTINIAPKLGGLGWPISDNLTDKLASAYRGRGEAYLTKERFDLAIDDFSAAIANLTVLGTVKALQDLRIDDDVSYSLSRAFDYRGRAYLAIGDYGSAVADFYSAIRIDPDKASEYDSRYVLWADEARDRGEYDLAILGYTIGILIDPDDTGDYDFGWPGKYNGRGLAHLAKGDYDLAIADFETAITIDPSDWLAHENLGKAYIAKLGNELPVILQAAQPSVVGEYDLAMAAYNAAIGGDPNNASGYMNRGLAYLAKGDFDSANADFNTAIRIAPENRMAYKNRIIKQVIQHSKSGDYDLAIMGDTIAIGIDSNDYPGYYNRGLAYLAKDEYDLAIADFETAISISPDFYEMIYENRDKAYRAKENSGSGQ